MKENSTDLRTLIKAALDEDIGRGDLTSLACLEPDSLKANIVAKSSGCLSGRDVAEIVFEIVDSANRVKFLLEDGDSFTTGDIIAEIDGFNLTVLTSERVALNFLGHLSGIATLTNKFVSEIRKAVGDSCQILDTRKTMPGWRRLEKQAVLHGGGKNHREGLYDMVLIKDNHIASAGSISKAIERTREYLASTDFRLQFDSDADAIVIEVEISSEDQLISAMECGVRRLLLDNQTSESLTKLVKRARQLDSNVKLEASGNVTLETVGEIAQSGVDFISVGALTHSAPVVDFSLRVQS